MGAKKKTDVAGSETGTSPAPSDVKVSGVNVVHVHGESGALVRSYSREVHGDDFLKNAKEFSQNPANVARHGKMAIVEE